MKTNTHNQNHLTTTSSAAQGAKPLCERLFLGIDQHAADLRIVRQLDGAGTQPPQRIYPGVHLEQFIKKQLALAHKVFAVYEAGPCGFVLARQLKAQRRGPRDAWIATWTRWPGSQRMVE